MLPTNNSKPLKEEESMKLKDKNYKILKKLALIYLPVLATLWIALGTIWGFPYLEQVAGTITAIDVALGSILGISTKKYNKSLENDLK